MMIELIGILILAVLLIMKLYGVQIQKVPEVNC